MRKEKSMNNIDYELIDFKEISSKFKPLIKTYSDYRKKRKIEKLKKEGISNCHLEGKDSNEWKLIDGIDIIIHIFNPEKRKFYNLEKMWSELLPKERLMI